MPSKFRQCYLRSGIDRHGGRSIVGKYAAAGDARWESEKPREHDLAPAILLRVARLLAAAA
jgi:hypothetical protein